MSEKVCIVGDGGWGTAIGLLLHANGYDVTIWGPFEDYLSEIRASHMNQKFLPGVEIPREIVWTHDPRTAAEGAAMAVLATPSHFYRQVCAQFSGLFSENTDVVSVSKGLCAETGERLSITAAGILKLQEVIVLSGPSHAEEVSRGIPTAVVVAGKDRDRVARVQSRFSNKLFRVYSSSDPLGVELGGAIKNVLALAVGMSDGLGFGDNSRAALITRGLAEMARLGVAMGGAGETFAGLSGIGDLVVTCTSRHSRNRSVGERLGKGETAGQIQAGMKQVAEGVWNCPIIVGMAHEKNVEMPICETVKSVLEGQISAGEAVNILMGRDTKKERFGK